MKIPRNLEEMKKIIEKNREERLRDEAIYKAKENPKMEVLAKPQEISSGIWMIAKLIISCDQYSFNEWYAICYSYHRKTRFICVFRFNPISKHYEIGNDSEFSGIFYKSLCLLRAQPEYKKIIGRVNGIITQNSLRIMKEYKELLREIKKGK
jgi:hypothetical protein